MPEAGQRVLGSFRKGLQGIGQDAQRVVQALEGARLQDLAVLDFEQAGLQGQEMPGQVPAVHGGDVARRQRGQGQGVVPVVEMAFIPFQRAHGAQRLHGAVEERAGRDEPEVAGGEVRQQRKAHVGRRGAVRNHGGGVLLEVVGGEPLVLGADECFEEGPGLAGRLAQKESLFLGQHVLAARDGAADPPDYGRGEKPEREQPSGHRHYLRRRYGERERHTDGQKRSDPHGPERAGETGREAPGIA
ncbi:hypothetical protein DSECCO2_362090 [anaerobic digester metagenome]